MKIINTQLKSGRKMYIEQFENYQEYINTIEQRNANIPSDGDRYHTLEYVSKDSDFTGVENYQQAKEYLLNGWDRPLKQLNEQVSREIKALQFTKVATKNYNDVAGYMPIVPNALLGLPTSMINQRKDVKKTKVLRFLLDTTFPGALDVNKIIKYYSKVLAKIALLEQNGFRCRIETTMQNANEEEEKTIVAHTILLKSENRLLDLKKMCFLMCHPAMLRIFDFAWQNSLPLKHIDYNARGMGTALYCWKSEDGKKEAKEVISKIIQSNEKMIYVYYGCDLNEALKEAK